MPVTYRKADAETLETIARVIQRHHPGKHDAGVSVQCLLVFPPQDENGEALGPALKHAGYPCAATIRQTSLKERAAGFADLEILLDNDQWTISSNAEQAAVIDHELCHFDLKTDRDGGVIRDDLERPKFIRILHDRQLGWFDAVARRHGPASGEVRQCREMLDSADFKQCYLFDLEEDEEQAERQEKPPRKERRKALAAAGN